MTDSKPLPIADALSWGGGCLYLEADGETLSRIDPKLLQRIAEHVGRHGATATPLLDAALNAEHPDVLALRARALEAAREIMATKPMRLRTEKRGLVTDREAVLAQAMLDVWGGDS